jgi:tetratricopeptide (TPR) repeat protein
VSRLYELGAFESALAVSVSAVEKARELFGEEHPAYASALNNAALLHKVHRQDYAAAEQLYQRALNAYAVSVGDTHPSYLTTLSNLALVCRAQGHLDEARTYLERAVQAHRNAAAGAQAALSASPSTATAATAANAKASMPLASALLSLGGVLSEQGLFDEAIALQEEALLLSRRRFGEEHPATATALNNLALTHKNAARFESALTFCQQALAIRSRNLPPTHPDLIVSLNNLAELLRAMGQMDKAAIVQQKIIDIIEAQELENNPKAQQEAAEKQVEEEKAKGQTSWRAANSSNNGKDDDATAGRSS